VDNPQLMRRSLVVVYEKHGSGCWKTAFISHAEANLHPVIFSTFFLSTCSLPHPGPGCLQEIKQEPAVADAEYRLLLVSEMKNVNMKHGPNGACREFEMVLSSTVRGRTVTVPRLASGVPDLQVLLRCDCVICSCKSGALQGQLHPGI
jgi:hypothetical protein